MQYIKNFLRKRKQSDAVKLITLFVLGGIVMLGMTMQRSMALYRLIKNRVEYVFTSVSPGGVTEAQIQYIRGLDYVQAVSREYQGEVMLRYGGSEVALPCRMVSEEYMENVYEISRSGMQTFYVNHAAYEELLKAGWYSSMSDGDEENAIAGILPEYDIEGLENGVARLDIKSRIFEEEGMAAVGVMDKTALSEHPERIRVAVTENDLTGENLRNLEKGGIVLVNETDAKRMVWEQEKEYLRLKYEAAIAVLCFAAAWCLKKYSA